MPRRPANVTQADIARAIRAVRDAGLSVARVVMRADGGVSVETFAPGEAPDTVSPGLAREQRPVRLW